MTMTETSSNPMRHPSLLDRPSSERNLRQVSDEMVLIWLNVGQGVEFDREVRRRFPWLEARDWNECADKAWQVVTGYQADLAQHERERAIWLARMAAVSADLSKVIELERSGTRDGDGTWHGSDVVGFTIMTVRETMDRMPSLPALPSTDPYMPF